MEQLDFECVLNFREKGDGAVFPAHSILFPFDLTSLSLSTS